MKERDLTFIQRLNLRFGGFVFIGNQTRPGWEGSLPFYVFRCPDHGLVESYRAGWRETLNCPECPVITQKNAKD